MSPNVLGIGAATDEPETCDGDIQATTQIANVRSGFNIGHAKAETKRPLLADCCLMLFA